MLASSEKWFTRFCDKRNILRGRIIAHLVTYDQERARYWKLRADGRRDLISDFPWESIQKVIAYKADLLTYDEIYIQFIFQDGMCINISEEAHGFSEIMNSLPQYLPGCLVWAGTWQAVALPAFKTNETTLYERY